MSADAVVIQGTLKPDGTLELDQPPPLPAGRVQVTIVPLPGLPADDPFRRRMQRVWEGQRARGHVPRSAEDVEAERRRSREEMEEENPRGDPTPGRVPQGASRGRRGRGRMAVYLDANIVIYLVERHPVWGPKASSRLAHLRSAGDEIATSDASRLECLVGPFILN